MASNPLLFRGAPQVVPCQKRFLRARQAHNPNVGCAPQALSRVCNPDVYRMRRRLPPRVRAAVGGFRTVRTPVKYLWRVVCDCVRYQTMWIVLELFSRLKTICRAPAPVLPFPIAFWRDAGTSITLHIGDRRGVATLDDATAGDAGGRAGIPLLDREAAKKQSRATGKEENGRAGRRRLEERLLGRESKAMRFVHSLDEQTAFCRGHQARAKPAVDANPQTLSFAREYARRDD